MRRNLYYFEPINDIVTLNNFSFQFNSIQYMIEQYFEYNRLGNVKRYARKVYLTSLLLYDVINLALIAKIP